MPQAITVADTVHNPDRWVRAMIDSLTPTTSVSMKINQAWCVAATIACDLLCWLRLLCLEGPLARAEPKTLFGLMLLFGIVYNGLLLTSASGMGVVQAADDAPGSRPGISNACFGIGASIGFAWAGPIVGQGTESGYLGIPLGILRRHRRCRSTVQFRSNLNHQTRCETGGRTMTRPSPVPLYFDTDLGIDDSLAIRLPAGVAGGRSQRDRHRERQLQRSAGSAQHTQSPRSRRATGHSGGRGLHGLARPSVR